jgi:hypothetical protein
VKQQTIANEALGGHDCELEQADGAPDDPV